MMRPDRDGGPAAPPSWIILVAVLMLHGGLFAALAMTHSTVSGGARPQQLLSVHLVAAPQARSAHTRPSPVPVHLARPQAPRAIAPAFSITASAIASSPAPAQSHAVAAKPSPGHKVILQHYAAELWARIAAHKRAGLHRGGTVEIAFRLDRRGHLLWVKLVHSSGDAGLDAAALLSVRAAAPFPVPPDALAAGDLVFDIPFEFS